MPQRGKLDQRIEFLPSYAYLLSNSFLYLWMDLTFTPKLDKRSSVACLDSLFVHKPFKSMWHYDVEIFRYLDIGLKVPFCIRKSTWSSLWLTSLFTFELFSGYLVIWYYFGKLLGVSLCISWFPLQLSSTLYLFQFWTTLQR